MRYRNGRNRFDEPEYVLRRRTESPNFTAHSILRTRCCVKFPLSWKQREVFAIASAMRASVRCPAFVAVVVVTSYELRSRSAFPIAPRCSYQDVPARCARYANTAPIRALDSYRVHSYPAAIERPLCCDSMSDTVCTAIGQLSQLSGLSQKKIATKFVDRRVLSSGSYR